MINKKILYTVILAGLFISLGSCRNLFSQKNHTSEESDTVIVSGKIISNIDVSDTATSRYAIPDADTSIYSNVWYTITAYSGTKAVEGTISLNEWDQPIFSVALSQGKWIIIVRGYKSETIHNSTTQVLEGRSESIIIDGNTNRSNIEVIIKPEPILTDYGNVNLAITVCSSINTIIAEWQQQVSGATTTLRQVLQRGTDLDFSSTGSSSATAYFTMKDTPAEGETQVNTLSGGVIRVPAGIYDVNIHFYTENYSAIQAAQTTGNPIIPVYTAPKETVYVFQNLQTKQWYNNTNNMEITEETIAYMAAHNFYVKFNSTESNGDGSANHPFKTIQAAVDKVIKVNDGGEHSIYTIYLLDDFIESDTTSAYPTTGDNKGTLVKIITETGKPLHLTIRSDSPSEKRTINVNEKGGIFYLNGGGANTSSNSGASLYLSLENLCFTKAMSSKSGGVIGMNNGTAVSSDFNGAIITLRDCILVDNISNGDSGGAVFVALHNSLTAYNTVFKNNKVSHANFGNGGAIYTYGCLVLDRCDFDGNSAVITQAVTNPEDNGSGGAIMVNLHSQTTTNNCLVQIKNSSFTNNTAKGAGGAVQINTVQQTDFSYVKFENVEIKNNKSECEDYAGGIGLGTQSTVQDMFEIKGANQITDNYCSDGAGGLKECNVYLPEDKKIKVTGSLSGSTIGITKADANTITNGGGLAFTNGDSTYVPANPTNVFTSDDEDYAVDSSRTATYEARIIEAENQSGSLTPNYDLATLDISLSRKSISFNEANNENEMFITVTVSESNKTLSANDVEMSYTLSSYGGEIAPESTAGGNTPNYFSLDNSNPFKLHFYKGLPIGNYELAVKAYDKKTGCVNSVSYVLTRKAPLTALSAVPAGTTFAAGQEYAIRTQADFEALATKVNATSGAVTFEGISLFMENDVVLTGSVAAIGKNDTSNYFSGIFDGQEHSIKYYNLTSGAVTVASGNSYKALFSHVVSGNNFSAEIKNVTVEFEEGSYSALLTSSGLIAKATGTADKPVIIQNCKNEAPLQWDSSGIPGGCIVGNLNYVIVTNCQNSGNYTSSGTNNSNYIGGGIAGYVENSTISNCSNSGKISKTTTWGYPVYGGICGEAKTSLFYNLKNSGEINPRSGSPSCTIGGIIGRLPSDAGDCLIYNCENTGRITANDDGDASGIVGKDSVASANVRVLNCNNAGTVKSSSGKDYISGIILLFSVNITNGYSLEIKNLLNTGTVKSATMIGASGHPIMHNSTSYGLEKISYENNYYQSGKGTPHSNPEIVTSVSEAELSTVALSALNNWVNQQNASQSNNVYVNWVMKTITIKEDSSDTQVTVPCLDLGF